MSRREERRSRRRKEQMKARLLLGVLLASLGILVILLVKGMTANRAEMSPKGAETGTEIADREGIENETEITDREVTTPEIAQPQEGEAENSQAETARGQGQKTEEELLLEKVNQKIDRMSMEEKVAQLFMITPEALTGYSTVTAASDVTREALGQYPVGGLILFSKNIVDPTQLSEMTGNLQKYAGDISEMPLFLGIDEEGGSVVRIASNSNFDVPQISDMRTIGDLGDGTQARKAGVTIGSYLSEYGLNVDFAPVADVLTNEANQLLQKRSFGTDPELVADMDMAFLEGLEETGVYGCLKHFPGHGGTGGDTHEGYAYTQRSRQEIEEVELLPFREGIENGISFIMVSHIAAESLTGDNTPASLSPAIITELLREQMGYDGIVITDAMNMGAITDDYNSSQAATTAILAGADIVLMPVNFKDAYQGVLDAVAQGKISEERIDESLRRIVMVKYRMEE